MLKRLSSFGLMVGIAVILSGCVAFQSGMDNQTVQSNQPLTLDEKYAKIAQSVPSFGGMFFDSDQNLNIYLTDQMQIASAQAEIASVLGISIPQANVRVLKGEYNFLQLKGWHERTINVFDIPNVVFTDIDETQNRLQIGIDNLEAAGVIQQELSKLRIPASAVEIIETAPIVPLATLQNNVRPLQGGLQINFPGFLCTYGFNAVRAGKQGFVTNSHCTNTQGGVESTPYWQPLQSVDPVSIGTEIADPNYFSSGACPAGKICRYSDSSFAEHTAAATADMGLIERTQRTGSLTIAGSFRIVNEATSNAIVGETLNKVGRTTGWSQGKVTNSCVNTGVSGTNIVQLCQDFVKAKVNSGDSGSPVFKITNSPATNDAVLYGILWGGGAGSFVYSPMVNVQRNDELGALANCASGFSC